MPKPDVQYAFKISNLIYIVTAPTKATPEELYNAAVNAGILSRNTEYRFSACALAPELKDWVDYVCVCECRVSQVK